MYTAKQHPNKTCEHKITECCLGNKQDFGDWKDRSLRFLFLAYMEELESSSSEMDDGLTWPLCARCQFTDKLTTGLYTRYYRECTSFLKPTHIHTVSVSFTFYCRKNPPGCYACSSCVQMSKATYSIFAKYVKNINKRIGFLQKTFIY